jgi:eukaryotic-like serine/threonine-protein kinase
MHSDHPGAIVDGKYALIEKVGTGGMATVWRALTYGARGFRREVAVKRIHEQFGAFPEVIDMFVEEARVGALLRHPNIVQIHDFGKDESERYYLVTEWVEGLHLGDYVRSFVADGNDTPWSMVTAITVEVLRGLDAAHTRRDAQRRIAPILHRDISPPNILLDVGGVVKLADFGLARAMDRGRITRPDVVKGKLSYLAPELVLGDAPSVQSDLFGLGVVLWEALTGARLFDAGTDAEVIRSIAEGRVPLLSMKRPALPMRLTTVVHRALERDPARRFGSALEMLEALREVLRVIPDSTSGPVLARGIAEARDRLVPPAKNLADG